MNKTGIKKDVLLIAALALIGVVIAACVLLTSSKGKSVQVRSDGEVIASYPLSQDRRVVLHGKGGGSNVLEIKNGEACISEADCPDELCVKTGKISRNGQSVICLPHKLVIEITGDEAADDNDVDVYVK